MKFDTVDKCEIDKQEVGVRKACKSSREPACKTSVPYANHSLFGFHCQFWEQPLTRADSSANLPLVVCSSILASSSHHRESRRRVEALDLDRRGSGACQR